MASDRRFGLPHPFDAELTGESFSRGRKPGLWETLKRALGTSPDAERPSPPIAVPHEPASRTPVVPARPVMPAPPAPDPVGPSVVAPAREAAAVEVDSGVPFLEDEPGEEEPPATPVPPAAREAIPESGGSSPDGASQPPPASARLARGLASFSRDNAEREKKYAHLLRDAGSTGRKRSPGSRKRS